MVAMFCGPLREKCPYEGLVWSVFLHILREYGDIICKSPYSVQMWEKVQARKNITLLMKIKTITSNDVYVVDSPDIY